MPSASDSEETADNGDMIFCDERLFCRALDLAGRGPKIREAVMHEGGIQVAYSILFADRR